MNSHDIVAKDVLQWLALYSIEAKFKECLFQQDLTKKDEEGCETMGNENWGTRKQNEKVPP